MYSILEYYYLIILVYLFVIFVLAGICVSGSVGLILTVSQGSSPPSLLNVLRRCSSGLTLFHNLVLGAWSRSS